MSLTERDKKIARLLIPLLVLAGYWFLLLAPKREEASKAGDALAKQEQRRDAARARTDALSSSRTAFASDYGELARLGKAVPTSIDMPSLIVQLDGAARGSGITFSKIATGDPATPSTPAPAPGKPPGKGAPPQPPAAGAQAPAGTTSAAGLETVPLELEFSGNFFKLADFFHRLKRFVRVANDRVLVRGRLLTIDSLKFASDPQLFPKLRAEIGATVYLSSKPGDTAAGTTTQGPQGSVPAGSGRPGGGSNDPAGAAGAAPRNPTTPAASMP